MQANLRMIALGLLAVTLAGCESTRWNWFKPNNDVAGKGAGSQSTAGLVTYLNDNARRIKSIRVDDMSIDATMGNQTIGLRGRIYAEGPRNFRMKVVSPFGKDEVDIGSNRDEFWFWAAKNPEPYQYYCSYDDLNQGRVKGMPIPIQPDWVMEAMGLGPYVAEKYTLEPGDNQTIRLVEKTRSPQGQPVRKVIVMNRREVKAPTPQVTAFLLIDEATGKEICSAHITATAVDRTTGAILPYKMELRMPAQKMRMALKLDGAAVNTNIAATAFVRQPIDGVEPFNLATGRPEPRGVLPVQGFQK